MADRLLVKKIQNLFVERGSTLALAESCTGGSIAATLVAEPGCSKYFLGGVVSYADAAKVNILQVINSTLLTYGAVSLPVVLQMACGAKQRFSSQWAVAVSGIAGPDGGQPDKPVGTVCFAVVGPGVEWQGQEVFEGKDRQAVIRASVSHALEQLWLQAND